MYTWILSTVEWLLAIVINHLGSPMGCVCTVCQEKTEREACRKQSIPMSIPASLREEQTDGSSCELHINSAICAPLCPVVLGRSLLLVLLDNLVGYQVAPLGVEFGIAKFDHANLVTYDVSVGNQTNKVCKGKSIINQQIVNTDATRHDILHHLDGLVYLRHCMLLDAIIAILSTMLFAIEIFTFLVRHTSFFSSLRPSKL